MEATLLIIASDVHCHVV